jgi:hypothetical protein
MKASEDMLLFLTLIGLLALVAIPKFAPSGHTSPKNTCINNLRLIDTAIQQWAIENNKTNSDMPTWADVKPYMGRGAGYMPTCPLGGTYSLGRVDERPKCSVTNHFLP